MAKQQAEQQLKKRKFKSKLNVKDRNVVDEKKNYVHNYINRNRKRKCYPLGRESKNSKTKERKQRLTNNKDF